MLDTKVRHAIQDALQLSPTLQVEEQAWMITTGVSILGQSRKTMARHNRLHVAKHQHMVSSANFILDADHVGRILTFLAVYVCDRNNPSVHCAHYVAVTEVFERHYDTCGRMSFCYTNDGKVVYLPVESLGRDVLGFSGVRPNNVSHAHIISDQDASSRTYIIRMQTGIGPDECSQFTDYT